MENKEIVGPGKFVKYAYRLYSYLDGQLLFETPKDAPDELVCESRGLGDVYKRQAL